MANLFWKLQCESKSAEPIDGWHFTSKQYFCDKYVDIIKVETQHCNLIKKFYVDLLDETEHVSIAAMLVSRKTKAKILAAAGEPTTVADAAYRAGLALGRYHKANEIANAAYIEYEKAEKIYKALLEKEAENETNSIGKNGN
jgi:transcription initiation factor TFIIIB Brf1 subunit/transcription initiation factor TFIIB